MKNLKKLVFIFLAATLVCGEALATETDTNCRFQKPIYSLLSIDDKNIFLSMFMYAVRDDNPKKAKHFYYTPFLSIIRKGCAGLDVMFRKEPSRAKNFFYETFQFALRNNITEIIADFIKYSVWKDVDMDCRLSLVKIFIENCRDINEIYAVKLFPIANRLPLRVTFLHILSGCRLFEACEYLLAHGARDDVKDLIGQTQRDYLNKNGYNEYLAGIIQKSFDGFSQARKNRSFADCQICVQDDYEEECEGEQDDDCCDVVVE